MKLNLRASVVKPEFTVGFDDSTSSCGFSKGGFLFFFFLFYSRRFATAERSSKIFQWSLVKCEEWFITFLLPQGKFMMRVQMVKDFYSSGCHDGH